MRMTSPVVGFLVLILGYNSCQSPTEKMNETVKDTHSAALPADAVVTHEHLNLKVDFEKKVISGTALLTVQNRSHKTALFLDTRALEIEGVYLGDTHHPTAFTLLADQPFLGKALKISISNDEDQKVLIRYRTTSGSDALQWLEPAQTAGKQHPFLFTQGQAILSRTWFPCQDSPGIRFSYSADIEVPAGLEAIMSADSRSADSTKGIFHFEMSKPVPAYLVALSVGNLGFTKIDERTGVFAEPEVLAMATAEFSEMGKMVTTAEQLYGAYRWGRYDVLVLPPSFPFGGMENPCVTFATPTILAGDKSLTSLIAHELAHSWSGNLVTNATWDDFWLNEGFTVYFERRIMEAMEGKDYADMLAVLGYQDLEGTLNDLGLQAPATHLKLNLAGKDPDEGMNDIAYEKGYLFLCSIEKLVGRQKWDSFVKSYFDAHAFQSMTTEQFLSYLEENLLKVNHVSAEKANLRNWIYGPGLPAGVAPPVSIRFLKAGKLAEQFGQSQTIDKAQTQGWSSHEWLHFLRSLPAGISTATMQKLDTDFGFTQSGNSEILFEWLLMGISTGYEPTRPVLDKFLMETGRRKFVLPLYKALVTTESGKAYAKTLFSRAKANYHAVTRQSVEALFDAKK